MTAPAPPLLAPPPLGSFVPGVFWRPSEAFVDELASALRGLRVLEIFGGNGYLARLLADRGVDIVCTSRLSSMDAHARGLYHPVLEMGAVEAVGSLGADRDALLLCWPTTTEDATRACEAWGGSRPIAFIGEFTDYSQNHLGGCATDSFFEGFQIDRRLPSYQGNMLEAAALGTFRPAPAPKPSRPRP